MIAAPRDTLEDYLPFAQGQARRTAAALARSGSIPAGDLEDFAADLVLQVVGAWPTFDRRRGNPEGLVKTVIQTRSVSLLRERRAAKRTRTEVPLPACDEPPSDDSCSDLLNFERIDDVAAALDALPAEQRKLAALLKGMPATRVAERTGLPRSTLRDRLAPLRQRFKDLALDDYLR